MELEPLEVLSVVVDCRNQRANFGPEKGLKQLKLEGKTHCVSQCKLQWLSHLSHPKLSSLVESLSLVSRESVSLGWRTLSPNSGGSRLTQEKPHVRLAVSCAFD